MPTNLKRYAGIGSRECPPNIIRDMILLGKKLAESGYILHSGGADGADAAFEQGCDQAKGRKEIYLPWRAFNNHSSSLFDQPPEAFLIAERIHPAWGSCSQGARKLHARNVQQVLGKNLDTPVDFVVCWTPGGGLRGGTATAMKLAASRGIPVFNLADPDTLKNVEILLRADPWGK